MRAPAWLALPLAACSYELLRFDDRPVAPSCEVADAPAVSVAFDLCGDNITVAATYTPEDGVTYEAQLYVQGTWYDVWHGNGQLRAEGVPTGTGYRWRMRAVAADCQSPWRESASFDVAPGPAIPAPTFADVCAEAAALQVDWTGAAGVTYEADLSSNGVDWTPIANVTQSGMTTSVLDAGTYGFRLRATEGACTTPYSLFVPLRVVAPPRLPSSYSIDAVCEGNPGLLSFSDDWVGEALSVQLAGSEPLLVDANPFALTAPTLPGSYDVTLTAHTIAPCADVEATLPLAILPLPVHPTGLSEPLVCEGETVQLTFEVASFGSYEVAINGSVLTPSIDGSLSLTLPPGMHPWTVTHITDCGTATHESTATVNLAPVAPSGLTSPDVCIDMGMGDATLSWQGAGYGTYAVQVLDTAGNEQSTVYMLDPSDTAAYFTAPAEGSYTWRVTHEVEACAPMVSDAQTLLVRPGVVDPVADAALACPGAPVTVTWSGGGEPGYYRVEAQNDDFVFVEVGLASGSVSSVTFDANVTPGTYLWRVRHEPPGCAAGAWQEEILQVVDELPVAPTGLSAPSALCSNLANEVSWTGAGYGSYALEIRYGNGAIFESFPTSSVWDGGASFEPLPAGFHSWRVRHVTACGSSNPINGPTLLVNAPPDAATALTPQYGTANTLIDLSWSCEERGRSTVTIDYFDGLGEVTDGITNRTVTTASLQTARTGTFSWVVTRSVDGCFEEARSEALITILGGTATTGPRLDPSFGGAGLLRKNLGGSSSSYATDVGFVGSQLHLSGVAGEAPGRLMLYARLLDDGTVEVEQTVFFGGATVESDDAAYAMAVASTSGAYLAGTSIVGTGDVGLAHFGPDGQPASFGHAAYDLGTGTTSAGHDTGDAALLLGSQLHVAGTTSGAAGDSVTLLTFDVSSGSTDAPPMTTALHDAGAGEQVTAMAADGQGHVLVAGNRSGELPFVVRFKDGTYEFSFPVALDEVQALLIEPLGTLLVAGSSGGQVALQRYSDTGVQDITYGTGGTHRLGGMGFGNGRALVALGTDLVAVAADVDGDFYVAAVTAAEVPWEVRADFGGFDVPKAMRLDMAGRLVLVGATDVGGGSEVAVCRVIP